MRRADRLALAPFEWLVSAIFLRRGTSHVLAFDRFHGSRSHFRYRTPDRDAGRVRSCVERWRSFRQRERRDVECDVWRRELLARDGAGDAPQGAAREEVRIVLGEPSEAIDAKEARAAAVDGRHAAPGAAHATRRHARAGRTP